MSTPSSSRASSEGQTEGISDPIQSYGQVSESPESSAESTPKHDSQPPLKRRKISSYHSSQDAPSSQSASNKLNKPQSSASKGKETTTDELESSMRGSFILEDEAQDDVTIPASSSPSVAGTIPTEPLSPSGFKTPPKYLRHMDYPDNTRWECRMGEGWIEEVHRRLSILLKVEGSVSAAQPALEDDLGNELGNCPSGA